jgi:hypothetical protein
MEHEQRSAGPKGYVRPDERIHDDVCGRLAYSDRLDVRDVEVTVSAGVVALSGTVRDRWQKYCIEEIADHVLGVTEVENHIRVARTDDAYEQATQRGLAGQLGTAGQTASQNVAGAAHVGGVSTSGSATGASASSYGGGMETGRSNAGGGADPYGGTTSPGRGAPDASKPR